MENDERPVRRRRCYLAERRRYTEIQRSPLQPLAVNPLHVNVFIQFRDSPARTDPAGPDPVAANHSR